MGILAAGALLFRLIFLSAPRVRTGDEGHHAESLFRFLAHDTETGLRLLSVVSGAALVFPSVMIARRLWGNRVAAFAGLFVVLQPNLISFSAAATTESLHSLLLMCVLFLSMRGMDAGGMRRRSIAMIIMFAVMLVPYFLLLRAETGGWTGGSNDAAMNLSFAPGYPARLGSGIGLLPFLYSSPFLLVLVPLGIFGRRWRREDRGAESLLLVLGVFPFVFHPLFRVELRYLVPYLPVHLLWAGAGCAALLDWFAAHVSPRRAAAVALAALVFLSLVPYTFYRP